MTNWVVKHSDENIYLEDESGSKASVWIQTDEDGAIQTYQDGVYGKPDEEQNAALKAYAESQQSGERGFGSAIAGGLGGSVLGSAAGIGGKKGALLGAILAYFGSNYAEKKKKEQQGQY
ncbi:hypothetical protein GQ42DRAFT_6381 [Ramicandelaber brevisporus]|nr:hypothetical protein GQ42DRAFT_6381 [Ramicandelaber brevisporus]